jgi:hypothetical protein
VLGAYRTHLPLLERAQQSRLQIQRQVPHLVQEQRAAVRGPKEACSRGCRSAERAARVPKELRGGKLPRQRGAVDRNEVARATAGLVDEPSASLACSGLAENQDGKSPCCTKGAETRFRQIQPLTTRSVLPHESRRRRPARPRRWRARLTKVPFCPVRHDMRLLGSRL